jgi:hypothetical protein
MTWGEAAQIAVAHELDELVGDVREAGFIGHVLIADAMNRSRFARDADARVDSPRTWRLDGNRHRANAHQRNLDDAVALVVSPRSLEVIKDHRPLERLDKSEKTRAEVGDRRHLAGHERVRSTAQTCGKRAEAKGAWARRIAALLK